jgi:hypothetical protein
MKNILAVLLAILLAGAGAFADSVDYIVDGGFDNGFVTTNQYLNAISGNVGGDGENTGDGWVSCSIDGVEPIDSGGQWIINGYGQAERTSLNAWSYFGFGQIVEASVSSGTQLTFSFDYTYENGIEGNLEAAVWGVQGNGDDPWLSFNGDSLKIASASDGLYINGGPEPEGNYLFVEEFGDMTITGTGTYSADITLSDDYDYLVIAFSQKMGKGSAATIDNVFLTTIPEPATIGMLGLGALITACIRRICV